MSAISLIQESINEAIEHNQPVGQLSDGYHTFNELYQHRNLLFINHANDSFHYNRHCKELNIVGYQTTPNPFWISKNNPDGSPIGEGWFLAGLYPTGMQISYHLPIELWNLCHNADELDKAPEWDGHTSADVIERLKNVI